MPRTVQITVPADRTDHLLAEIPRLDGLIGLQVQRGISLHPPGDVVTVQVMTSSFHALQRLLDGQGIGLESGNSILTNYPQSVTSSAQAEAIARDESEASWEEMEQAMAKESNMTANGLTTMAVAGVLAAVGICTNALHLVIGAMVIAPGFEPITRTALGVVAGSRAWRRGLVDVAKGYGALLAAAAVTAMVLQAMGYPPLSGEATYLPSGVLVSYWTSITGTSLLASAAASFAGAVLIAASRSILTSGVMIALALIPTATLAGMGLALGRWDVLGWGLLRWGIDLGLVVVCSALVFAWKYHRIHRRKMSG